MNEQQTSGTIESAGLGVKKDGGKFVKLTVEGKRYSFWDMDWYNKNPETFNVGNNVNILYYEKEYTDSFGNKRTSRVATAITKGDDFQKASEVNKENDIKTMMVDSWKTARDVFGELQLDGFGFTPEDLRSTALSIFIEKNRRK